MAGIKPGLAIKPLYGKNIPPALQKFMEKQNAVLEGKDPEREQMTPPPVPATPKKPAPVVGRSANQSKEPMDIKKEMTDENKNNDTSETSASNPNAHRRPSSGALKSTENRRVSVPRAFQVDLATTNNGPKPWAKQMPLNSTAAADINKPKIQAKPVPPKPTSVAVNNGRPYSPVKTSPAETKPSAVNNRSSDSPALSKPISATKNRDRPQTSTVNHSPMKVNLPEMDKPVASKTSASSNSISSSTSSSLSSSQISNSPAAEPGVFDFRNQLRSAKKSSTVSPVKTVLSSGLHSQADSTDSEKSPISKITPVNHHASGPPPKAFPAKPKESTQELKRQSSLVITERKSDSKKFKKIKLQDPSSIAPTKPVLPANLDLTLIRQQFEKAVHALKAETNVPNVQADDDIYSDAYSAEDVMPRKSVNTKESARISVIPDMSAEEEAAVDDIYDDGFTPVPLPPVPAASEEMYVDAETERKLPPLPPPDDDDNIYEVEDAFLRSPEELEEERKRVAKEEAEAKKREEDAKKREEKERRDKEKEEEKRRKKEEKEKAKKEKEEIKLKKQFNLTGSEVDVGEGVIKQDVKSWAGLVGLSLKKGQTVTIVRIHQNPPNKWLIRADSGLSYVDSNIIEVDPALIRQTMLRSLTESECTLEEPKANLAIRKAMLAQSNLRGDDQPHYDPVAQDGVPNDLIDDEDIYECCPD